ncbi:MFS transporter [Streptomyces sp. NPDC057137]|uniref:MFS transporter n=1 Tax=Streptomyces sp. NPDC057137 TaxID=3346030 RepID=UPI0036422B4D
MTLARQTAGRRPSRRRLLADRDACLYLGGQITSMLGHSSLWLAAGIWIKTLTGSSSQAALVWFAFILGNLTGPLSAVLIDRLPVRPLLIVTNLACAANVLLLLLVHGEDDAWLIYPVIFVYGAASALLNAGASALVRPLFGSELLPTANAVLATAKQGMNLFAPILGAGLFAMVGATPVIIADAVGFLVAATAISLIRTRTPRVIDPSAERTGAWAELSAGVRHLMSTAPLRRVVLAFSVVTLGLGFLEPAAFSVNSEGLQRAPAFMGVLFTFQGAGAVLGGIFSARAVRAFGEVRTAALSLAAASVGIALMALPALPAVLLGFALYGAALPWLVVAQQTQLQRLTPPGMQGRAAAAAGMLTRTPQACGIAAGSALLGVLGHLALIGIIAGLTAGASAWLFLSGRGKPGTGRPTRLGW